MAFDVALVNIVSSFSRNIPNILWSVIALLLGFLIGKLIGWIVKEFLVKIKIDQYIFEKEKFKVKLSDVFSLIARWIIYLLFILISVRFLNIPELTTLISSAITFLSGAVEATIIIIIGYSLAYYIKDKVLQSKTLYGDIVANILFFMVLYVSITLALPFVNIDVTLLNWILIVIVASFGIGMALAIGLGLKDIVREFSKNYVKNLKKRR